MLTTTLTTEWRKRHKPYWSALGVGPSAEGYAFVVAEHRLGGRTSLTYGTSLDSSGLPDKQARKLVRDQIDALFMELAPC